MTIKHFVRLAAVRRTTVATALAVTLAMAGMPAYGGESAAGAKENAPTAVGTQPPAAAETDEERAERRAFEGFRLRYDEMNDRVGGAMGTPPFLGLENLGNWAIRLTANDWWLKRNLRFREANTMALYRIWRQITGRHMVKVIVADGSGTENVAVQDKKGGPTIRALR